MEDPFKSTAWNEPDWLEGTAQPELSVSAVVIEETPAVAMTTVVCVALLVFLVIASVFLFGVLLDCRQQRILAKRINDMKKFKNQRSINASVECDEISIAQNMEVPESSNPPAVHALNQIP